MKRLKRLTRIILALTLLFTMSLQAEEIKEVRVEVISYNDGRLEAELDNEIVTYTAIEDKEVSEIPFVEGTTLGDQLSDVPVGSLLDMKVAGTNIDEILSVHLRMNNVSISANINNTQFHDMSVSFGDELISFDVAPKVIDGKVTANVLIL